MKKEERSLWSFTLFSFIKRAGVELMATEFIPEHAGQLNFYLSAIDAQVRPPDDNPTLGITTYLIAKSPSRLDTTTSGENGTSRGRLGKIPCRAGC